MRIAVLGGGISGLTASYFLGKKGHQVTLFEKAETLGGLAVGFKQPNWNWYLERAYHHLFANDYDILNFAKEIGFNKIFFKSPETASLYEESLLNVNRLGSPYGETSNVKREGDVSRCKPIRIKLRLDNEEALLAS